MNDGMLPEFWASDPPYDFKGEFWNVSLTRAVIPELGHLIQALRAPVVTQALLYGAPALLVGWLLLTIWRPARVEEDES